MSTFFLRAHRAGAVICSSGSVIPIASCPRTILHDDSNSRWKSSTDSQTRFYSRHRPEYTALSTAPALNRWTPYSPHRLSAKFTSCAINYNGKRLYATRKSSLYDILEVTPKASSSQVKAAYYRLSKQYHPDMNKSADAKEKFAAISQAYEILGNKRNRQEYERGFVRPNSSHGYGQHGYDADYRDFIKNKPKSSGKTKPPPRGRSDIYNFDEFYKQHYGDFVKEGQAAKLQKARRMEEHNRQVEALKRNKQLYIGMMGAIFMTILLFELVKKKQ